MLRQCLAIFLLFMISNAAGEEITLTFIYQQTYYLSCERVNSDPSSIWLKNNVIIDTSTDPNLSITNTGSLVFDKFEFSDTGSYQCQETSIIYQLTIDCPANSDPNALSNQCICSPGATSDSYSDSLKCDLCPLGWYKAHPGDHDCFQCLISLVTEREGSLSETSCICPPGLGISNSLCVPCLVDSYQDKYEEVPCQDCPDYSGTPQPQGEADPEAFTNRSDCECLYSPDNADNATCWPFVTTPYVTMVQTETTTALISWVTESYARADNGAYRGIIAGYHLEVIEDNELNSNVFTHKYTPLDYTPGQTFMLEITDLEPDTTYTVAVNAYTKATQFVDGPPSYLTVTTGTTGTTTTKPTVATGTTISKPTVPTGTTVPATPYAPVTSAPATYDTTGTTGTTIGTTIGSTISSTATAEPTDSTTQPTTVESTPRVVVNDNNTATSFLSAVVVIMAIFIAILVVIIAVRYWRGRRRRSKQLRYTQTMDNMKRIGPNPHYAMHTNAVFLNADAGDSLI